MTTPEERTNQRYLGAIEMVINEAKSSPECFKCGRPITELAEVRIVTVRVDGERKDVWMDADCAKPDQRTVDEAIGGDQ